MPKESKPKIILVQGSLSPDSRTAILVEEVAAALEKRKIPHETIDLRKIEMQFCDGLDPGEYNEDMQSARRKLGTGQGYVIGFPVYNYSFNSAIKAFIEICSEPMRHKYAGIVSHSAGVRSFMASVDMVKVLSFHEQMICVQPTVHTFMDDYTGDRITNDKVRQKIESMLDNLMRHLA